LFDDWFLAMAAYNCGEMRVLREINRSGVRDFWKLRLPRETRNHVPKILAAIHILENPEKYNVELPKTDQPYLSEEILLNKSVSLKDVADLLEMAQDELKVINSDLRYGVTPPAGYSLRVPLGAGATLLSQLDKIPVSTFRPPPDNTRYRVRRGDTLGHIARRFRTSVSKLRQLNRIRGNLIRVGQTLLVPGRSYSRGQWSNLTPGMGAASNDSVYTVRRGDSLGRIARYYSTTVTALKQTNNLSGNLIHPGQKLRLPGYQADGKSFKTYNIRSGDTLARIARTFNVPLPALMRANPNLKARNLKVGQRVIIPG